MKTCQKCGYNLKDDELFCKMCGTKYEDKPCQPISAPTDKRTIVEPIRNTYADVKSVQPLPVREVPVADKKTNVSDEQVKAVIDELRNASLAMEKASQRLVNAYQSGLELISRYSDVHNSSEVKTEPLQKPVHGAKAMRTNEGSASACNKCGCRINPTDVFCGTCGAKIGG